MGGMAEMPPKTKKKKTFSKILGGMKDSKPPKINKKMLKMS
jgi:hypothetical protein